ncbi:hypothetical protein ACXR0O_24930 [Verrucomicrobiota bacterium sgz303538]
MSLGSFLHPLAVVAAVPAAFVGVIIVFCRYFPEGSKTAELLIFSIAVGLPAYVSAGFDHSWMTAVAIHGIAFGMFLVGLTFQNRLEACVVGLIFAALLTLSSTVLEAKKRHSVSNAKKRTVSTSSAPDLTAHSK